MKYSTAFKINKTEYNTITLNEAIKLYKQQVVFSARDPLNLYTADSWFWGYDILQTLNDYDLIFSFEVLRESQESPPVEEARNIY